MVRAPRINPGQRRMHLTQRKRKVLLAREVEQHHQMTSHPEGQERDGQGLTPEAEERRENPSQDLVLKNHFIVENPDQGHIQELNHLRKDLSQGHVPGDEITKDMFQNPDHVLIQIVSQGLDHQDGKDHILDQEEGLLFLRILEGFHLIAGREVVTALDKGRIRGLEGHVQEKEALREDQGVVGGLAQDLRGEGHVLDLYRGVEDKDLSQDLARTREGEEGSPLLERENGVRQKVVPGPSQNRKRKMDRVIELPNLLFLVLPRR